MFLTYKSIRPIPERRPTPITHGQLCVEIAATGVCTHTSTVLLPDGTVWKLDGGEILVVTLPDGVLADYVLIEDDAPVA